jgi:hypothetical protein
VPAILASYTFGQSLLAVLEIFLLIIWVWLLITVVLDLIRDHETSGWSKAIWVFFLIVIPILATLVYLIVRGQGMREREINHRREIQQVADQYIRNVATSPADELVKLTDLREKGVVSDEEFDRLKARIIA